MKLLLCESQLLTALVLVVLQNLVAFWTAVFFSVLFDKVLLHFFTNLFMLLLCPIYLEGNGSWTTVIPLFDFHGLKVVFAQVLKDLEHFLGMNLFFKDTFLIFVQLIFWLFDFFAIFSNDRLHFLRIVNWITFVMHKAHGKHLFALRFHNIGHERWSFVEVIEVLFSDLTFLRRIFE